MLGMKVDLVVFTQHGRYNLCAKLLVLFIITSYLTTFTKIYKNIYQDIYQLV